MDYNKEKILKISMLGGMKLEYGDKCLSVNDNRTKQIWSLLEFLICHRFIEISADKFIEVLWNDEGIDNPNNALKNLVYRLRLILNKVGRASDREYIIFKRGTYGWNNSIKCIIDTEEMERLIKIGDDSSFDLETRAENYIKAISLYRGEFLSSNIFDEWTISIRTYFRKLYIDCILKLCAILTELERYQDIENVCTNAIAIEPFEESIQEYLLKALIKLDKYSTALEHYKYVSELFNKELGVNISLKLREIYRDALICFKKAETDIDVIIKELREEDKINGAFLCDYEIFKNLYRIMARLGVRTKQRPYLGVFTLVDENNEFNNEKNRELAMQKFGEVAVKSLRKGDIISRFSSTQYVVLFQTLNVSNAQAVLNRICLLFENILLSEMSIKIHSKLFPIEPISKTFKK